MTSHFNFKITQEEMDKLSKLLAWHERVKAEMIDTLAVYGNVYTSIGQGGLEITEVWIDEAHKLSKKQVEYLTDRHLKLMALDAPKKQKKPKHKVPFWVQDWRKK